MVRPEGRSPSAAERGPVGARGRTAAGPAAVTASWRLGSCRAITASYDSAPPSLIPARRGTSAACAREDSMARCSHASPPT